MKSRLDEKGAADEERLSFVGAIEAAISAEPNLADEGRDSVRDALHSAFDGIARTPVVLSVKCNFLNRVRFRDSATSR